MDVNSISGTIDTGMNYVHIGASWVRDLLTKLINYIPGADGRLWTIILMFAISLYVGHWLAKGFVTRPYGSSVYLIRTLIISILIFITLTYI